MQLVNNSHTMQRSIVANSPKQIRITHLMGGARKMEQARKVIFALKGIQKKASKSSLNQRKTLLFKNRSRISTKESDHVVSCSPTTFMIANFEENEAQPFEIPSEMCAVESEPFGLPHSLNPFGSMLSLMNNQNLQSCRAY